MNLLIMAHLLLRMWGLGVIIFVASYTIDEVKFI